MDREDLTKLYQFIITVVNVVKIVLYANSNPGYIAMLFAFSDRQIILLFIFGISTLYILNGILDYLKKKNPGIYWSIRLISEVRGFSLYNYL